MTSAIVFQDVSKQYRGSHVSSSLRDELATLLRGRRTRVPFQALSRVSFEVPEGQNLAIIGDNGAGKTTALKLACRISYPSAGTIRVRGRVGALLEVGTGLHPELSGRENIQLYGRILGLQGREITARFDEIVDFSGVEAALDRPVKFYSSGMQMRLGFSLAAHLEPDILLVDEALSVGDVAFQKKCLGKMREVGGQGRTVVFVSHDMGAIRQLAERTLLLREGTLAADGPTTEVVERYLRESAPDPDANGDLSSAWRPDPSLSRAVELQAAQRLGPQVLDEDEPLNVRVRLRVRVAVPSVGVSFTLFHADGTAVGSGFSNEIPVAEGDEFVDLDLCVEDMHLAPGDYFLMLACGAGDNRSGHVNYDAVGRALDFTVGRGAGSVAGTAAKWRREWGAIRFEDVMIARLATADTSGES